MDGQKDAFYVVKKGNVIGVYGSFSDCQDQAGSSLSHPSTAVYKGYGLPKEAEKFLSSHGLRNASYTISSSAVPDGLFGTLMTCPFQQPDSSNAKLSYQQSQLPRHLSHELLDVEKDDGLRSASYFNLHKEHMKLENQIDRLMMPSNGDGSTSYFNLHKQHMKLENQIDRPITPCAGDGVGLTSHFNHQREHLKIENPTGRPIMPCTGQSCILEFDGASKGNPGPAGAGAVLRAEDGTVICRLQEGIGRATNNVAEYRAVILGLRHALKKGFKHIQVQGDSQLVCMQIQGLWKLKNPNMAVLCKEAMELKQKFTSFKIKHVLREFNSEADTQANLAIPLKDGEVQVL